MDYNPNLPKGLIAAEMNDTIPMTERLNAELNQMLKEHVDIMSQLKTLTDDALKEDKLEYAQFAEKLTLHGQTEEESLSGSFPCGKIPGDETIRKTITTMQPSALVEHVN